MNQPHLIYFPHAGNQQIGFITIAEWERILPFRVQRIFWTYGTPSRVTRGQHAHKKTEQVLIAVAGKITVQTETHDGQTATVVLDNPNTGLYLPPWLWHTLRYSKNALQLVLASTLYDENDYFRIKTDFTDYWSRHEIQQ